MKSETPPKLVQPCEPPFVTQYSSEGRLGKIDLKASSVQGPVASHLALRCLETSVGAQQHCNATSPARANATSIPSVKDSSIMHSMLTEQPHGATTFYVGEGVVMSGQSDGSVSLTFCALSSGASDPSASAHALSYAMEKVTLNRYLPQSASEMAVTAVQAISLSENRYLMAVAYERCVYLHVVTPDVDQHSDVTGGLPRFPVIEIPKALLCADLERVVSELKPEEDVLVKSINRRNTSTKFKPPPSLENTQRGSNSIAFEVTPRITSVILSGCHRYIAVVLSDVHVLVYVLPPLFPIIAKSLKAEVDAPPVLSPFALAYASDGTLLSTGAACSVAVDMGISPLSRGLNRSLRRETLRSGSKESTIGAEQQQAFAKSPVRCRPFFLLCSRSTGAPTASATLLVVWLGSKSYARVPLLSIDTHETTEMHTSLRNRWQLQLHSTLHSASVVEQATVTPDGAYAVLGYAGGAIAAVDQTRVVATVSVLPSMAHRSLLTPRLRYTTVSFTALAAANAPPVIQVVAGFSLPLSTHGSHSTSQSSGSCSNDHSSPSPTYAAAVVFHLHLLELETPPQCRYIGDLSNPVSAISILHPLPLAVMFLAVPDAEQTYKTLPRPSTGSSLEGGFIWDMAHNDILFSFSNTVANGEGWGMGSSNCMVQPCSTNPAWMACETPSACAEVPLQRLAFTPFFLLWRALLVPALCLHLPDVTAATLGLALQQLLPAPWSGTLLASAVATLQSKALLHAPSHPSTLCTTRTIRNGRQMRKEEKNVAFTLQDVLHDGHLEGRLAAVLSALSQDVLWSTR